MGNYERNRHADPITIELILRLKKNKLIERP